MRGWIEGQIASPPSSYIPRAPGREYSVPPPALRIDTQEWIQDSETKPGAYDIDIRVSTNRSVSWARLFYTPRKASSSFCVGSRCYKRGDAIPLKAFYGNRSWSLGAYWSQSDVQCPVFQLKVGFGGKVFSQRENVCLD